MGMTQENFRRSVERNWPRCADGSAVLPGDVVDVEHVGRMRVVAVDVAAYGCVAVNGFDLSGLKVRRVPDPERLCEAAFSEGPRRRDAVEGEGVGDGERDSD